MKVGPHHLTYCLNVHAGEAWKDQVEAIEQFIPPLKQSLCPNQPLGLGLRISAEAADELLVEGEIDRFKELLHERGLYVFTINGFPYGAFHDTRVKEQVYFPDWTSRERLDYTLKLADILAQLLPEDCDGSISTVPLSFKSVTADATFYKQVYANLKALAKHFHTIEQNTGRRLHLGLEPEPCCTLETTKETLVFFKNLFENAEEPEVLQRYIGVNFDCCHLALQFEEVSHSLRQLVDSGILISKVHLSAALELKDISDLDRLKPFMEPTYLHQVKVQTPDGLISYVDLPDALLDLPKQKGATGSTARIHFHVPLGWEGEGVLQSTRALMDDSFWSWVAGQEGLHLEIETYTWDVLPEDLKHMGLGESILGEFEWVLGKMRGEM